MWPWPESLEGKRAFLRCMLWVFLCMVLQQKDHSALSFGIISRPGVAWMLDRVACVLHTCSGDANMQVIMYDEPTAGLDPVASTVVEDLMRSMHDSPDARSDVHLNGNTSSARSGITSYIVVTHQHSTIRRAVDRLIFLHEARAPTLRTPLSMPVVEQHAHQSPEALPQQCTTRRAVAPAQGLPRARSLSRVPALHMRVLSSVKESGLIRLREADAHWITCSPCAEPRPDPLLHMRGHMLYAHPVRYSIRWQLFAPQDALLQGLSMCPAWHCNLLPLGL